MNHKLSQFEAPPLSAVLAADSGDITIATLWESQVNDEKCAAIQNERDR